MTAAVGKIQNVSGRNLEVPSLGGRLVFDKQVVEVPLDAVTGFTQQEGTWAAHDKAAKQAHGEMLTAIAALLAGEVEPTPAEVDSVDTPTEEN